MSEIAGEIAIIGAGPSGTAAAWRLSQAGVPCRIFEKSRGISGRAATRRKNGQHYDHGANFFRLEDTTVARIIQGLLPSDALVEIPGNIHTFDAKGSVMQGDPDQNAQPKWTCRQGINTLGKAFLANSPHAGVIRESRIIKITNTPAGWLLDDHQGNTHGTFKDLLITIPAPQAAELFTASGIHNSRVDLLKKITYHPQFTFILAYPAPTIADRTFHALVNPDGEHPISWLSFEEDKPGHIPDGKSTIIIQMSPIWTARHYDMPPDGLLPLVIASAAALLQTPLPQPAWWDSQRWRYAHPIRNHGIDISPLTNNHGDGIHFAGDGLAGKGRVASAITTGIDAADRILNHSPSHAIHGTRCA